MFYVTNDTKVLLQFLPCVTNTVLLIYLTAVESFISSWPPDLHSFVHASGCNARSFRRPGDAVDVAGVAGVDAERTSGEHVPHLHGFIIAAGCDAATIKRPCYSIKSGGAMAVDEG